MLSKLLHMCHCLTESQACKSHRSHFLGEEHEALRAWVLSVRVKPRLLLGSLDSLPGAHAGSSPSSACLLSQGRCRLPGCLSRGEVEHPQGAAVEADQAPGEPRWVGGVLLEERDKACPLPPTWAS